MGRLLALAQAEAALQADPEDHGLWELKAKALSKLGRHGEATAAARKAVETEPGCAVRAGVDEARLESYRKLKGELEYLDRRRDAAAQAEFNKRWKQTHKAMKRLYKERGK